MELRRRLRIALGMSGALAVGLWLGRGGEASAVRAEPPATPAPQSPPPSDYSQRVVAYIYGNVPITREDLGEYLIARQGVDKVELLVNKRIIEHACQQAGVAVSAAEINAAFDQDCGVMNVDRKQFVDNVLKQYGKTVYEWKEDVLRPRLMLQKMCQSRVKVNDDDLRRAFEAHYGEKVECRIIIWPKGEERIAQNEYGAVRKNEESFLKKAREQANSQLAARGGLILPIARFSGTHAEVEKWAFRLQPGEISELIATPEGTACLRVERKLPADDKVKLDDVREQLTKSVFDTKVTQEIAVVMKELREKAKPVMILKKGTTDEELKASALSELQQTGGIKK